MGPVRIGYGRPMGQPSRTRRTATLASLAAELGVSRTTVSNAYNRPDQLSAQLRQRVLDAAKRLGYPGPDPVARSLRTRRAGAVGLLLTETLSYAFRDPGAVLFLEGLALACEDAQTGLLVVPAVPGRGTDPAVVARAAVDGFVVYSMPDGNAYLQIVLERPVPTVVVDEPTHLDGVDWVGVDDRAAMAGLVRHLTGLGHRRIAVVATKLRLEGVDGPADVDRRRTVAYAVIRDRLAGVADALGEVGVPWEQVQVEERADHLAEAGAAAAHALLERQGDLTAIVCMTDLLALGVLTALRERGVAVPAEVSVSGYDDVPAAEPAGLTTVRQPLLDKGRIAGALLFDPGERPEARRRTLPTELVVRATTGPAPGSR